MSANPVIHILADRGEFLCGIRPDGERSYVGYSIYSAGTVKPVGTTRYCPFCIGALANKERT